MKSYIKIYLKGMLMGVADLIPGISGGTIAFIVGIYTRFINALASISYQTFSTLFFSLKKGNITNCLKTLKEKDFDFLSILILGIITTLFLGATIISYLFEFYESFILAFFIGLIISSTFFLLDEINEKINRFAPLFSIGLISGFVLFFLPFIEQTNPSLSFIFFAGIIASSAMIIPGLSGSFLLLIIGIYPHLLVFLSSPFENLVQVITFGTGIIIGVLSLAKILQNALKNHKNDIFSLLIGLIVGTLLIPITSLKINNVLSVISIIFLSILGMYLGFLLKRYR